MRERARAARHSGDKAAVGHGGRNWLVVVALLGGVVALAAGCASTVPAECEGAETAERARFGDFESIPRARIGCLPFPGLMTLYTPIDAESLGEHGYSKRSKERSRGVLYTERGGFLDIAHIRNTIDLTAYIHARVSHAMHNGWDCVRFATHEGSVFVVMLDHDAFPAGLGDAERSALIDEAAVQLAQRLAVQATAWHEILTWFGYKSTVVFSEAGSAFTYEDGTSHAVGAIIAGEALRRSADATEFDANCTVLLDETLWDLGAVDRAGLSDAVRAVRGDWWSGGRIKRRMLETGLEPGGVVCPWLAVETDQARAEWRVPALESVSGFDLSGLASIEIEPRVMQGGRILSFLAEADGTVVPDRDFPALIGEIREKIGAEFTALPATE